MSVNYCKLEFPCIISTTPMENYQVVNKKDEDFYGQGNVEFTNIDTHNILDIGWSVVVLKSSGVHCIAYIKGNNLCYAEWNGSGYDIEVVDSGVANTLSTQLGFKLGYMDIPYIAYYKNNVIKFAKKIGKNWVISDVALVSSPDVYISMTVCGSVLYPAIAFIDSNILKCAEWYGEEWVVYIVDKSAKAKKFTDIVYSDGKYHILYYKEAEDCNYSLMYAYCDLYWLISVIDKTNTYHKPSIFVRNSNVYIAYIGNSFSLKYGYKSGTDWNWNLSTLRSSETICCCMFLNKNNYPVIVSIYWDGSNDAREVLEFDGNHWISKVLEVNSFSSRGINVVINVFDDTRYFVYTICENTWNILRCVKWLVDSIPILKEDEDFEKNL